MGRLSMASYIPQFNSASLPMGPARKHARCHHASSELASVVPVKGLASRSIKELLEFPTFWQRPCFFFFQREWQGQGNTGFGETPECSQVSTPPSALVSSRPFREETGMEDCFRRKC